MGSMTRVESRKVQLTGGGTYVVSLPKDWVKAHSIGKGSEVIIEVLPDNSLRITPKSGALVSLPSTAEISVTSCSSIGKVIRGLVSYYVVGFDTISINFPPTPECSRIVSGVKEFVDKRMIGVEVVEESMNSITLQCLTKYTAIPVTTAFKRMVRAADYMLQDVIDSLSSLREDVLSRVIEMDDIVDRFYLFVLRQLNAVILGIMPPSDLNLRSYFEAASLRMAAKFIERVGDHAQAIASEMLRVKARVPSNLLPTIKDLIERARKTFLRASKTLLKYDTEEAHEIIDEVLRSRELEDVIIKEALESVEDATTAVLIKRLTESARRIMEYAADISEVVINTATAHKKLMRPKGLTQ